MTSRPLAMLALVAAAILGIACQRVTYAADDTSKIHVEEAVAQLSS